MLQRASYWFQQLDRHQIHSRCFPAVVESQGGKGDTDTPRAHTVRSVIGKSPKYAQLFFYKGWATHQHQMVHGQQLNMTFGNYRKTTDFTYYIQRDIKPLSSTFGPLGCQECKCTDRMCWRDTGFNPGVCLGSKCVELSLLGGLSQLISHSNLI